jgi:Arc/MetJ family transcription regulator
MMATLELDDDLVRMAQEFTGLIDKSTLVHEALKSLVERESYRRLGALGGTMPEFADIPRRQMNED